MFALFLTELYASLRYADSVIKCVFCVLQSEVVLTTNKGVLTYFCLRTNEEEADHFTDGSSVNFTFLIMLLTLKQKI